MDEHNAVLFLSLHLSSHSPYLGLAEMGATYPLRESVKRMARAGRLNAMLNQVATKVASDEKLPNMFGEPGGVSGDVGAGRVPAGSPSVVMWGCSPVFRRFPC